MSIKIKKQTGEIFDLPADFIIEGEKNNPLFSTKGSQTVPISFPTTPRNRRLLGDAFRLDRVERPSGAIPVVVESGATQQAGLMSVNGASTKVISANIGFDEAEMYSRMSTLLLRDMEILKDENDPQHHYNITPPGDTREERVEALLIHLTNVMKEFIEADYCIFPVVLKYDRKEVSEDDQDDKQYRIILNETDVRFVDDEGHAIFPYGAIAELKGLHHQMLTWYINDEEVYIDAMTGYGVSPFLKVGKLLEIIFLNFGYTLEENPFVSHRQLKKLVVLNNTMDTILSGALHYRDLMPDMTVNEFLESLFNKFGLLWLVDSNRKTVRLRFLKDLMDASGTPVDINRFKTEEPEISFSAPRQLKLTANRDVGASGFGLTSETLFDTFEEFLQTYNFEFTEYNEGESVSEHVSCTFYTEEGQYHIKEAIYQGTDTVYLSSSDFFDWDKKTPGLEYEEIEMKDLCLPFDYYMNITVLHYGANVKHRYSNVIVEGETPKEEENPASLAFAFAWGLTDYTEFNRWNWFFASQINRNSRGHFIYDAQGEKYDISLTINREDGLYNRFWKAYDAFLRHSCQEVKCRLKFSDAELINLKMDTVMMMNFQPFIPEQVKFKLNDADSVNECILRTLRLYKPYDLEAEQEIPQYENQKYYWKQIHYEKQPPVLPSGYSEYGFGDGYYIDADGIRHDTRMLFVLPPTQEQFQRQEQMALVYHTIAKAPSLPDISVTTTITFAPAEIVYP
jgi:hypothetical protein